MGATPDPQQGTAKTDKDTAATGDARTSDGGTPEAALAMVQMLLAQGADADGIAPVVKHNPAARDQIVRYLQTTKGNAFVVNLFNTPILLADAPLTNGPPPDPITGSKDLVEFVVKVGDTYVQVYVSPGGTNQAPDLFMFFHGYYSNLEIDPAMKGQKWDNVSGRDAAKTAMKGGTAKNTIACLPQGVHSDSSGAMPGLAKVGFEKFTDDLLVEIGTKLGKTVTPKHISLAGHSAGGYEGIHDALSTKGKYGKSISDVTLMDSNYSETHFKDTQEWMFEPGDGPKTVRIIQSGGQIDNSYTKVKNPADPDGKKISKRVDPYWRAYFGDDQLDHAAALSKTGMTIKHVRPFDKSPTDERTDHNRVVQHSQLIAADGSTVQCDILVMQSRLGHHEIRDSTMDDAIDTIGQGAAGAAKFGTETAPNYGRDPSLPHDGDVSDVDTEKRIKKEDDDAAAAAKRHK
jgi:hypothetical protein